MYLNLAVLHMEKSVLGLLPAAKDERGRLNTQLQYLEGGVQDRRARVFLQGLKTLIFSYAPTPLKMGTLVRDCN